MTETIVKIIGFTLISGGWACVFATIYTVVKASR